MKFTLRHLLVGLSLIATTSCLALIQTTTTEHLQSVYSQAISLKPANTLVVFDIDNTLLRMKTTLGSPQWFNWQSQEIALHATDALADSMANFYPINDFALRLVHTKPCEPQTNNSAYLSTQQVISTLQDQGYTVIAESAREPAVRFTTEKQLANNQIFFNQHSLPYTTTPTGCLALKSTGNAMNIAYCNGILYTTGAPKAEQLNQLLTDLGLPHQYQNIVFADDTPKNITDFQNFYSNRDDIHAYLFQYNGVAHWVNLFNPNDKILLSDDNAMIQLYEKDI